MKTIKTFFVILLTAALAGCGGGGGGGGDTGGDPPSGSSGPIYTVSTLTLDNALNAPSGLTIDTNGNLYVADTGANLIKKIQNLSNSTVNVSSVLGGGGTDYSTCSLSKLYLPYGVAVDSAGILYVAERNKTAVRYADCTVSPSVSAEYGTIGGGQSLLNPSGIALFGTQLYVADTGNKIVRLINSNGGYSGTTSTLAGIGTTGYVNGASGSAAFSSPTGVVVASTGQVFVTDKDNCAVRMISSTGQVSTFAGSGPNPAGSGPVICGSADGTGTVAQFNHPTGIAVDGNDNLYVADSVSNKIRRITPQGVVTTIAGTGSSGSDNGEGTVATFNSPTGIAVDSNGNVYVVDSGTRKVRKITVTP